MTELAQPLPTTNATLERERLLRLLALTTFIIFFQGYMVAPIIPLLSKVLQAPEEATGLIVPAYLIPYGISTLIYGLVADRIGIQRVMFASLAAFSVLTMLTATAQSVEQLTLFRIVTGIGASGVVPLALALVGQLYPYEQRGRALGWLFGAMAGGMAFGSPLGAMLVPAIGWRGLFLTVGAAAVVLLLILYPSRRFIAAAVRPMPSSLRDLATGYNQLLRNFRGARTYLYVLLNSMFHSGVFTWLGLYLERKHGLGPAAIGLALLGYGIPGFLLGPVIGRLADRWGRARLIPIGLLLGGGAAAALALNPPATVPARSRSVSSSRMSTSTCKSFWGGRGTESTSTALSPMVRCSVPTIPATSWRCRISKRDRSRGSTRFGTSTRHPTTDGPSAPA
jgi:predicted MFS family arabinose efflux permease